MSRICLKGAGHPLEKETVKRMDDAKNDQLDRNHLDDQEKDRQRHDE
jgi:hypothetical protein